jgi:hypothetical protein
MRAQWALALACIRYRATVSVRVREQLTRWQHAAEALSEPALLTLASRKLADEGFNAEAAAMLATTAPTRYRANAVEAIVALEVLYDYLDGRSETSATGAQARLMFAPYTSALAPRGPVASKGSGDDPYALELAAAAGLALAQLPAIAQVRAALARNAARGVDAQTRMRAGHPQAIAELFDWAATDSSGSGLRPREYIAAAAGSVIVVHALIAAAARHATTPAEAQTLEGVYLSIAALATLLDATVDRERDADACGYLAPYENPAELAETLTMLARDTLQNAGRLPRGSQHAMILAGVLAYYATAPGAKSAFAAPVIARLRRELRAVGGSAVGVLTVWRAVRRARSGESGASDEPIGEPWPSS